jgi:branched-chain amino acid transport system permease protein
VIGSLGYLRRRLALTIVACMVVGLAVAPWVGLPLVLFQVAFLLFFYLGLSESWNILGGYGGYLSFGHGTFVGIGGYTIAVLLDRFGWPPFWTFPLAGLSAGLMALLIAAVALRIRGPYFLIATMLVLFIVQSAAFNLRGLTHGALGIDLPLFTRDFVAETLVWYYVGLVFAILSCGVAWAVERSRFGLALMAIREDEEVARSTGVRVVRVKTLAFVLSAAMAGLLGAAFTYRAHVIEPVTGFSLDLSAAPVLMAILGGTRTWLGPLVGSVLYVTISTEVATRIGGDWNSLLFASFLILVVFLLPTGLLGASRQLLSAVARPSNPAGGGIAQPAPAEDGGPAYAARGPDRT